MDFGSNKPGWMVTAYLTTDIAEQEGIMEVIEVKWLVFGLEQPTKEEIHLICSNILPTSELLVSETLAILIPPM